MEVEQPILLADESKNKEINSMDTENVLTASEKRLDTNIEKQQQQHFGERNGGVENQNKDKPRKKHRRGAKKKHRNKYKPYNKLTWDEKRKLDEKDALKAVRRREELVAHKGRPIAPYNTTQFLMEEHDPGNENLQQNNHHHSTHSSTSSTEGIHKDTIENEESSSSCSSDEYFDKDFDEFYERIHIDTLNSYTKEDLIKNVYDLERRIETLEKENKKNDIELLKDENQRLIKENQALREKVSKV